MKMRDCPSECGTVDSYGVRPRSLSDCSEVVVEKYIVTQPRQRRRGQRVTHSCMYVWPVQEYLLLCYTVECLHLVNVSALQYLIIWICRF